VNPKPYFLALIIVLAALVSGCSKYQEKAQVPNDAQLAVQVQQRISSDTALSNSAITINANDGVVTLTGRVGSEAELKVALADVQQIQGVKQVVSRLEVGETAMAAAPAPVSMPAPVAPVKRPSPARARVLPSKPATSAALPSYTAPPATAAPAYTAPASVAPVVDRVVERPPQPVMVPAGTSFQVRLMDSLSSETAQPNQSFRGTLNSEVMVNDQTVIPAGADVEGQVVDVHPATHYTGQAMLALQVTRIRYNGATYNVVTDQWTRKAEARGKSTATKVGTGAAIGAVLGGIFGGGKGAAIGATAGAGAGAGANTITKGKPVELGPESLLSFRLESPVSVMPSRDNNMRHGPALSPDNADNNYGPPRLKHGPVLTRDSDSNNN
jgi:hypothetical protein